MRAEVSDVYSFVAVVHNFSHRRLFIARPEAQRCQVTPYVVNVLVVVVVVVGGGSDS